MKLNKKGFTVVELVLSFSLVMILAVSMFAVINNYRIKQKKESVKRELVTYINKITKDIYDDIYTYKVKEMSYCGVLGAISNNCVQITFMDDSVKKLKIEKEKVTEYIGSTPISVDSFSIIYDGVRYRNPSPKFASIINDYLLTYVDTSDISYNSTIYRIKIRIGHQDLEEEQKIDIVATGI